MSMWSTSNEDATSVSPDQITTGRRLGFMESIEASYDEAVRYSSQFGAERALQEEEAENVRRIRAAGGTAPEQLGANPAFGEMNTSAYSDFIYDTPGQRSSVNAGERNDALAKLKEQFPDAGILTYDEMFEAVKGKSDAARRQAARGTTFGGAIGGFIGAAAGGLDPRYNPLNFATLPVGFGGGSVAARVGLQAGGQGAIETVNQFTGVRENQRALGGNPTLGDAALAIGGAAVAGGVLQAGGEAVGALGRRWFRNTPTDPAPALPELPAPRQRVAAPAGPQAPIPPDTARLVRDTVAQSIPGANTRTGRRTAGVDLDYVAARLDTWAPDARPWELAPPTSTALPGRANLTPAFDPVRAPAQSLDEAARLVDPQTFAVYDKLAARVQTLRAEIGDTRAVQTEAAQSGAAQELRAQIDQLRGRLTSAKPKQRPRIQSEVDELEATYAKQFGDVDATVPADTGAVGAVKRDQLQRLDYKMRDMAPAVSRAYARARNEWIAPEELEAAVRSMSQRGDTQLAPGDTFTLPERMPDDALQPVQRYVPELQAYAGRVELGRAAEATRTVQQAREQISEEALDAFRGSAARALNEEGSLVVEVNGRRIELDEGLEIDIPFDTDDIGQGFRSMNTRQVLEEIDADNQIMQAVTTCQIR